MILAIIKNLENSLHTSVFGAMGVKNQQTYLLRDGWSVHMNWIRNVHCIMIIS